MLVECCVYSLLVIAVSCADLTCVDPTPAQLAAIPGVPPLLIPGVPTFCGALESQGLCHGKLEQLSPVLIPSICPASCNTCVRKIEVGFGDTDLPPFSFVDGTAFSGVAADLTRELIAMMPNVVATEHPVNFDTIFANQQVNLAPIFINSLNYIAQKHPELTNTSFSNSAVNFPFHILTHYAKEVKDPMTSIFLPFTGEVWAVVLGTIFVLGPVLIFLEKTSKTNDIDHEGMGSRHAQGLKTQHMLYGWYYTLTTLLGDGYEFIETTSGLGHLCRLALVFFCFIFQATYTANLATILTKTDAVYGVESVDGLRSARICFPDIMADTLISPQVLTLALGFDISAGAVRASTNFPDFNPGNITNPQDLQAATDQLFRQRVQYCMEELRTKRVEAIVDTGIALTQYLSFTSDCSSYRIVPGVSFGATNFGMRVLMRNEADEMFLHTVNEAIFRAQAQGKIDEIWSKHENSGSCSSGESSTSDLQISLDTFYGVFVYTGAVLMVVFILWAIRDWQPFASSQKQHEESSNSISIHHTQGPPHTSAVSKANFSECELSTVPGFHVHVRGEILQDMQRQVSQLQDQLQAALDAPGTDVGQGVPVGVETPI